LELGAGLVLGLIIERADVVKRALASAPSDKVQKIGGDENALNDLRRYLSYGSRVNSSIEAAGTTIFSIVVSEYTHSGQFSISGSYLLLLLLVVVNVVVLMVRVSINRIDAIRDGAALGHYALALIFSAMVIVLNISRGG
jgi:hypothetical protein